MDGIPEKNTRGVAILLDEAASGLKMPSFSNFLSHCRKFKVKCLIGLQSVEQLKETYGDNDAATIMSNCYLQMYYSEQSHSTAKMLEEMLGRYNYDDEKGNTNLVRNLMEANEIRMLGKNRAIIIAGSEKPILAELTPYFERLWLKFRANLKPPYMLGVDKETEVHYVE
jgi:type IV secretion system protein VirD4